jgi:hypothetical protein
MQLDTKRLTVTRRILEWEYQLMNHDSTRWKASPKHYSEHYWGETSTKTPKPNQMYKLTK